MNLLDENGALKSKAELVAMRKEDMGAKYEREINAALEWAKKEEDMNVMAKNMVFQDGVFKNWTKADFFPDRWRKLSHARKMELCKNNPAEYQKIVNNAFKNAQTESRIVGAVVGTRTGGGRGGVWEGGGVCAGGARGDVVDRITACFVVCFCQLVLLRYGGLLCSAMRGPVRFSMSTIKSVGSFFFVPR